MSVVLLLREVLTGQCTGVRQQNTKSSIKGEEDGISYYSLIISYYSLIILRLFLGRAITREHKTKDLKEVCQNTITITRLFLYNTRKHHFGNNKIMVIHICPNMK